MDVEPIPLSFLPYAEFFNDIWQTLQLVIENAQDCHKLIVAIGNYIADVPLQRWTNLMKQSQSQTVNQYGFVWIMNNAFGEKSIPDGLGKILAKSLTATKGKPSMVKCPLCLIFLKFMEYRYTDDYGAQLIPEPFLPGSLFLLNTPKFKAKLMLPIELEDKYRQFTSSFYQGQPVWLGATREHPFFSAARLRIEAICAPTPPGATRKETITVQTLPQQQLKPDAKLKRLENAGHFHRQFRERGRMDGTSTIKLDDKSQLRTGRKKVDSIENTGVYHRIFRERARMDGSTSNINLDPLPQIQLVDGKRIVNFGEDVQIIPAPAPVVNSNENMNNMEDCYITGDLPRSRSPPTFGFLSEEVEVAAKRYHCQQLENQMKTFFNKSPTFGGTEVEITGYNSETVGQEAAAICPNAEDHLYNSQIDGLHELISSVVNISKEEMFQEMVNYILDKYSGNDVEVEIIDVDVPALPGDEDFQYGKYGL